jgi:uncharacterized membrane protein
VILHVPPGSPLLVRDAAAAILALHIGGGVTGAFSGLTALAAPKGGRLHRVAGQVFFGSMLVMAVIGTAVSPFLPNWTNVSMGLFLLYLLATAWMTVRRPAGQIGRFEVGALLFACAAAAIDILLAMWAAASPGGRLAGDPAAAFLVLASFPALSAATDAGVIRRGGVSGPRRLARHLWRMSVALFIAAGSLFLGQQRLFPHVLRGSPIMFAPEVVIVVSMIVWLVRTRGRAPNAAQPRASGDPALFSRARNLFIEQKLVALGYLDSPGSPLSRG